jgi:hypothetical protein
MDAKYVDSWGQGYRSNAEGMEKVKAKYERELSEQPQFPGRVTVNRRDDIGMIEVLLDRDREANGRRFWQATYWPIDRELKGPDGTVSSIGCATRHDPEEKRYGNQGWRCAASIRLAPHSWAHIDVYVSQLKHMPAIYDQVKQLLINAQQPSDK